jgi:hypothetical protein
MNKIFIFILIIYIFINISGCGNKSDEIVNTTVALDLIYNDDVETEPSTEIISSTMSFSPTENTTLAENTTVITTEGITETTKIPETSELSEITEITEDVNITDLYVITPSGKKYHYPTCRTVKSIKEYLSKDEAEQLGYEPCKICNPK